MTLENWWHKVGWAQELKKEALQKGSLLKLLLKHGMNLSGSSKVHQHYADVTKCKCCQTKY